MSVVESRFGRIYRWCERNAVTYLFLVFTVPPLMIIWLYVRTFSSRAISDNPEHWAWFGDFLAGALGPFVTLLTVLFLGIQLLHNKQVINLAAEELAASRSALAATMEELQLSRNIQEKTEGALNKQIELTIIAEGYRYHHGLVESSKEAMIKAAEHSTSIAKELKSLGIDVYEQFDPEVSEPNEMQLRENYLESVRLAEQAQGQFMSAKKMEREFGVALSEPALDLVRAYGERQANSPADASSPTQ